MKRSLRRRIAQFYAVSAALLFGVLLLLAYLVVQRSVFNELDRDLDLEAEEVSNGFSVFDGTLVFVNLPEWTEPEHGQVEVNPRFLQVSNLRGEILKQSPNMRGERLYPDPAKSDDYHYNTSLSGAPIRQRQAMIHDDQGGTYGWLLVAMPRAEAEEVLGNLRMVLWITYPVAVLLLFLVGRFIAVRSMAPVERLIETAERITSENLDGRMELPGSKDELYRLTITINQLLDRLREAVHRERQFTADASHELRTPLAVLKGTMEVLIRKPRTPELYEEKIRGLIGEVDRLSRMVDQLLLLARLEDDVARSSRRPVPLAGVITDVLRRLEPLLQTRSIDVVYEGTDAIMVVADPVMLDAMIGNIVANAIKFSPMNGRLFIECTRDNDETRLRIRDEGAGIPSENLPFIFDRFFRSDESRASSIQGTGLGLTIVRRLADLQGLQVSAESTPGQGTTMIIRFPVLSNF
ncbi:MAG: HAMP domain-containing protein [Bacteroidetes bacterium]|nr:HAMP domain-containing protein [Bacteroidota bacterium]